MAFVLPDTDCVYITGLPSSITEADVAEFFGSIGVIKFDKKQKKHKVWLYRDKVTGDLKGDGTVTYEDPFSAGSAVQWFNGKDWKGTAADPPVRVLAVP
jgi:RNA recognition motif-containing protein